MATALTKAEFWETKYSAQPRAKTHWLRRCAGRGFDRALGKMIDGVGEQPGDILEIGCAPGRMLERMHYLRPQHRLHGIDYARDAVDSTRQMLDRAGVEAEIHFGDMRTSNLPAEYDLVMSFGLIEHFDDPVEVLRNHARFCKPGGRVAVTVPNFATPIVKSLLRWSDPSMLETHSFEIMNVRAVRAAMEQAGFTDVQVGACGGPRIAIASDRKRLSGRMYRQMAFGWNFVASVLPGDLMWQATIWGTGVAPKSENR